MEDLVRKSRLQSQNHINMDCLFRLFDVSKQVVGQMFVHGANIFLSDLISQNTSGNACVFYCLHILLDTTLGEEAKHSLKVADLCWIQASRVSTSFSVF